MTTLLNALCQGILLSALVWVLMRSIPRLNAATRYAVWWLALLAIVLLPARSLLQAPDAKPSAHASTLTPTEPASSAKSVVITQKFFDASGAKPSVHPSNATPAVSPETSSSPALFPIHLWLKPMAFVLCGLWAALSVFLLARLAAAFQSLWQLKRGASPAPQALQHRLEILMARVGVRRQARLLASPEVTTPMAVGLFRPAILIPPSLPEKMSDADFDHVALHELAHLRRYDDWINLFQQLLTALLPIQPAIFLIGRELTLERETACDDWVISVTSAPAPYAASLTRVAEFTLWARCGILASGAAGRPSQLYRRVQRLLDKRRNVTPRICIAPMSLGIGLVVALAWLTLRTPAMFALTDVSATPSGATTPAAQVARHWFAMDSDVHAETIAKSFDVQPGDKLTMDVEQGSIEIKRGDEKSVGIVVTERNGELAQYLKHHHINMSQSGHEIRVTTNTNAPNSSSQLDIHYAITLPKTFDANVKTAAGDVSIAEISGALSAFTGAGNVNFRELGGTIDGQTGAGNVDVAACRAQLHLHSGAGNIDSSGGEGSIVADTGAGNIDCSKSGAALELKVGDGNIEFSDFTGPAITVHTGTGNIEGDIGGDLKSDSSLTTAMGNVELKLKPDLAVNLTCSSGMGNVDSDFRSGPLNGGGPALKIQTSMGNIELHKK